MDLARNMLGYLPNFWFGQNLGFPILFCNKLRGQNRKAQKRINLQKKKEFGPDLLGSEPSHGDGGPFSGPTRAKRYAVFVFLVSTLRARGDSREQGGDGLGDSGVPRRKEDVREIARDEGISGE